MKVLARLGISVLMILVLTIGVSYGQRPGKEFYDKGVEYATQGNFKEAKVAFEKALKADPFFSCAKICLKTIEDVIGQKIESDTAIHLFKGVAYGNKGMIDEKITEYSKAVKTNPRYANAYNIRGIAYYRQGQYARAIQDYNRAIETNPRHAHAYLNRGFLYLNKLGDKEKGCSDLKRVCELGDCRSYNLVKTSADCK
jgi:tetratricopeptide (TPR) repeat protein